MNENEPAIFPVTDITTGSVLHEGLMLIQFGFLAHQMQGLEQAQQGRTYALTVPQCRHLAQKISALLPTLENAAPPDSGGLRH